MTLNLITCPISKTFSDTSQFSEPNTAHCLAAARDEQARTGLHLLQVA